MGRSTSKIDRDIKYLFLIRCIGCGSVWVKREEYYDFTMRCPNCDPNRESGNTILIDGAIEDLGTCVDDMLCDGLAKFSFF